MGRLLLVAAAALGCDEPPPLTLGIDVVEHESYFPINPAAPHAMGITAQNGQEISCDVCHAGTESFRDARCVICHQFDARPLANVHSAIAGYESDDLACLGCHQNGLRGDAVGVEIHSELWFPITPDDTHGGPAFLRRVETLDDTCSACHASVDDRSVTLCAECHAEDATPMETVHLAFAPSFANNSTACKDCHGETPISGFVHPLDNHYALFPPDHHGARCQSCHQQKRREPKEWTINFAIGTCTACHVPQCTIASQGACVQ